MFLQFCLSDDFVGLSDLNVNLGAGFESSPLLALSSKVSPGHSVMVTVVEGTLSQQPAQPQREGQVVLLGTLYRGSTKETPLDGVSGMGNPMLGKRSLVSPKVWQPGCRL